MSTLLPDSAVCDADSRSAATLNRSCFCISPDLAQLQLDVTTNVTGDGPSQPLLDTHPGLFSSLPVFVSGDHLTEMAHLITAIEAVVAHPAYQAAALQDAPAIAAQVAAVPAVLQGFDFHLTDAGPRLIEINTNAGGAMLVASLLGSLRCGMGAALLKSTDPAPVRQRLWQMFQDVWRRAGRGGLLGHVAIVDERPAEQYLYPEFLLFQQLLELHGVHVSIADPQELRLVGGVLQHRGERVDLVYNRLTDFYLEQPAHAVLRDAAVENAVVLTPGPRAHALYANKRNLALLTDQATLRAWGVPQDCAETLLRGIPFTRIVDAKDAGQLWAERKTLFFKPARGYGSRGSYRGSKLTRRTFGDILAGDYVAQTLVPPCGRAADPGDPSRTLKFDVRNYVYEGEVLLRAARLYDGQTTNFRTPGGGFAPVIRFPA